MPATARHAATPDEATHASLLAAYRRHLETERRLSPGTVRNYLADLAPLFEYLANEGIPIGRDAKELRDFVERDGARGVNTAYRGLVRDFVSWLMEGRRLRSGERAGSRGHARASVVRTLVAVRSFVRYLIDRKRLPDSPLWQPRSASMRHFTPKRTRRLPDVVSTAEAAQLLEAPEPGDAKDPKHRAAALRDRAMLELLYGGGLRVSEASGLDVGDVALESRTARLWGKGSKARMVPLGRPAADALTAYLREGRPLLATEDAGAALFVNQRGGRLSARSVQALVRRYAATAGVRDGVHPHTLRHSYATHLLDGGADLRIVQELLGHSTPSATQVYTHVSQSEARRAYLSAHPLARGEQADTDQLADS